LREARAITVYMLACGIDRQRPYLRRCARDYGFNQRFALEWQKRFRRTHSVACAAG